MDLTAAVLSDPKITPAGVTVTEAAAARTACAESVTVLIVVSSGPPPAPAPITMTGFPPSTAVEVNGALDVQARVACPDVIAPSLTSTPSAFPPYGSGRNCHAYFQTAPNSSGR